MTAAAVAVENEAMAQGCRGPSKTCGDPQGTPQQCADCSDVLECWDASAGPCVPPGLQSHCIGAIRTGAYQCTGPGDTCAPDPPAPLPACVCELYTDFGNVDGPNGIDDDCDGIVDEPEDICDNNDNDLNGAVDDAAGSCLGRFVILPLAWQNDTDFGRENEDFKVTALEEWETFLSRTDLQSCPSKALMQVIDWGWPAPEGPNETWGLRNSRLEENLCDDGMGFTIAKIDAIIALRDRGIEIRDLDHVVLLSNTDLCGTTSGGGERMRDQHVVPVQSGPGMFLWAKRLAYTFIPSIDKQVAHEIGHNFDLRDEYCTPHNAWGNCADASFDVPNYLDVDLGCAPFPRPHFELECCSAEACGVSGSCCAGNRSDLPGDAPGTANGGRCLMGSAQAGESVWSPGGPIDEDRHYCLHCQNWLKNPINWTNPGHNPAGIRGRERDQSVAEWNQLPPCPPSDDPFTNTTCLAQSGAGCLSTVACTVDAECVPVNNGETPICHAGVGRCVRGCFQDGDCEGIWDNLPKAYRCDNRFPFQVIDPVTGPVDYPGSCVRNQICDNSPGRVPLDCAFQHQGTHLVQFVLYEQFGDGISRFDTDEAWKGRSGWGKQKVDDWGAGAPPPEGVYRLELSDTEGNVLASASRRVNFFAGEPDDPHFERTSVSLDERFPLPDGFDLQGPLRISSLKDGIVKTRTTLRGVPPVADAGQDFAVECETSNAATASLDGSGSRDDIDGDLISFYNWTASGGVLWGPGSVAPTGIFPLGPSSVALVVNDGRYYSPADTITVTVQDTTAPEALCLGDEQECAGPSTPVTTACSVNDACSGVLPGFSTALDSYPLGVFSFTCSGTDPSGNEDLATCHVRVVDTTPPVLSLGPSSLSVCTPDPQVVALTIPTVSDACGQGNPIVTGSITKIRGKVLTPPLPVPADGKVLLPTGTVTVVWNASDASGNPASQEQGFTISIVEGQSCCGPGQAFVQGTSGGDSIVRSSGTFCVLAKAGNDFVLMPGGGDLIMGGPDGDNLNGGGGQDILLGADGGDSLNCGSGGFCTGHGGGGDDFLQSQSASSSKLWGGPGADHLTGGPGADVLVPGSGADDATASGGTDTVILYDVCEATPGKTLSGGAGSDTLISPVSVSQLGALGVGVSGFETIVVDTSKRYLADCF